MQCWRQPRAHVRVAGSEGCLVRENPSKASTILELSLANLLQRDNLSVLNSLVEFNVLFTIILSHTTCNTRNRQISSYSLGGLGILAASQVPPIGEIYLEDIPRFSL